MWQKCPICNGSGTLMNSFGQVLKCDTCNGTKIISEVTGLPPTRMNNSEKSRENMFDAAIRSVRKDNPDWNLILQQKEPVVYGKVSVNNLKWVEPSIEGDAKNKL